MSPSPTVAWSPLAATVSVLLLVSGASSLLAPPAGAQQVCGNWVQVDAPAAATPAFTDVEVLSASEAFALSKSWGLGRWDGTAWSPFPLPSLPGGYSAVAIDQIGVVGPSHLFLSGRGVTGPFSTDQLLTIWDGSSWSNWHSLTLQPNIQGAPRNGAPNSVAGAAVDDVWIVGIASGSGNGGNSPVLTVHWDGSRLTEVMTPGVGGRQNNLHDAAAIATNDIWAVGEYSGPYFHGVTYHWDGSSWTPIPNPSEAIPSTHLNAVAAIASDDVWAAGAVGAQPLFMHWDGSAWTIVPAPATTGTIYGLAAIATDDVWAVDAPAQVPLFSKYYHWDGVAWSIVAPPTITGATNVNRHGGLAAVGACDVWAVGSFDPGSGLEPFIERLQASGGNTNYCTAGTTVNGCHATMGGSGTPSLSNAGPFTLTTTTVEGNKNGILFYGITGRNSATWGIGGTSFLCVKSPTQRTPLQSSGGTAGQCDGSFALDWNGYVAANPLKAINQALAVGIKVRGQAWFRDPGSVKNTSLSDGLEWTVSP